jgi:LacI family transcriptional regulator
MLYSRRPSCGLREDIIANLRDVATLAGVSTSTVSHVVNGTRFVNPDTKERVEKAIKQLGFVPNRVAQGLRTGSTRTIGIIGLTALDRLFAEVIRGVEERCYERGYEVFLGYVEYPKVDLVATMTEESYVRSEREFVERIISGESLSTPNKSHRKPDTVVKEVDIIAKFASREVDGLILNSGQCDEALATALAPLSESVVLYQRKVEGLETDACLADDYGGTLTAARRLVALGHERIAMLYGYSWPSHSARGRFRAWVDAHREAGLPMDPELLRQGHYDRQVVQRQVRELLTLKKRPTAILCWSDTMALIVMDTAREMGLSIPRDLSVVGFDDLEFASLSNPRLSTISQGKIETGYMIADRVLDKASGKVPKDKPTILKIPTEYIERESVAKPGR